MLIKKWWKYRLILFAVISTVAFFVYFSTVFSSKYNAPVEKFRLKFSNLETELDNFLNEKRTLLNQTGTIGEWSQLEQESNFNLHVYRNDSLIFWNTNQLPILRFADIHFPSQGIIHLQNGWYYSKIFNTRGYTVCGSFLIKHDYSYENKDLVNNFVKELAIPFEASIGLEQENGYAIYGNNKDFLFSLIPNDYQPAGDFESSVLMLLLLSSCILWLLVFFSFNQQISLKKQWVIPTAVLLARICSLHFVWFGFMHDTQGFQPSLYGTNEWFPNFFEYLLNCAVITYLVISIRSFIPVFESIKYKKGVAILLLLLSFPFWAFILYLNKGLIENSSIPLIIDRLFSLNIYSVFALISIGVLFYGYFQYVKTITILCKNVSFDWKTLSLLSFLFGVIFLVYEFKLGNQLVIASIFPMLLSGFVIFDTFRSSRSHQLGIGLFFLILFSGVAAINLADFNSRKEKGERELYANQLATERDVVTEVEYSTVVQELKNDNILKKFIGSPMNIGFSDFEDGMERRIFHGFWERYEMNFYLFDTTGTSLIRGIDNQQKTFEDLNEIIGNHGTVSEIDTNMHFINDYTGQYSYIIRQKITDNDSSSALLYCTLKSKKIPEEIGFPRLLISSEAKVFESLENYSIAKYHKGRLVTKYGDFNFPSSDKPVKTWPREKDGYYNFDGYNHFVLNKSTNDVIVLSSKNFTWVELVTSFSYLFSFYGILLLPLLFQFNYTPLFKRTLSLAVKIQLLLIGLVFVSLLAFGWGSGVFVSNQYNEYTEDVIREKLFSVDIELRGKLGTENTLNINDNGNYMEFLLQKFSKVFVTDINMYDTHGFMIASSRPQVFNVGLLSEQMNPTALQAMLIKNKSEFIHQENIGSLNYASAYLPFYSNEGVLLGFVNLQHFGQQTEFENQIQQFLVAIINVFMLLLAVSIVLAIFVSNWVTTPLRLLQESFANVRFGKYNQQIKYEKEDEIGALVKDYNQKLEELEFAAEQLAQNERESAWREMAKQVAHEIKNPLTPMKLSVQQLLRVYDPNDPNSQAKLIKVSNSIIEQIDALTKIANEFSNFAKMPRPNEVALDLKPILENVIEVFRDTENCTIDLHSQVNELLVKADKDQMVRVFNNLIKNAIQSIPEDRHGEVTIEIDRDENWNYIRIKDNGIGIEEDKKSKIFVPYFTTKSTGTGLGLAMVKQIVENHRGNIHFESEQNKGTTFFLELPRT